MTARLGEWRLLRTEPDEAAAPDELAGRWADALPVDAPSPVGAVVGPGVDVDAYDWWMRARVTATGAARVTLHGVTAPGVVYLDGEFAADVESTFLPVHLDLDGGEHEVVLRFPSLRRWLRTRRPRGRWRSTLVPDQGLRWLRTTLIGRAPVYGAGALPAPVGVWRPVTVDAGPRVDGLRIDPDPATGGIRVRGAVVGGADVRIAVVGPDGTEVADPVTVPAAGGIDATAVVPDPRPWWPRGYGAQPLYRVRVEVDGVVAAERRVGFRTVAADRCSDGFQLRVNGIDVFARGVTWVPPDPVALTVDASVLRAHLATFAAAGATMVRVVGGLVYEQPEFYELCAELGLLVWQDVMQATFDPPAETGALMCRELDQLLGRLSGNPAFAVVSGGSETEQQPEMLGVDAAGREMPLLRTELTAVVAAHGGPAYVTSTPSSPGGRLAIAPDVGVAHWFGVGGYLRPLADVRTAGVRFAAESLAFAVPPRPAALDRHFASAAQAGHHPAWKAGVPRDRTAAWDFEDVRDFYVREVFGVDPAAVRRADPERYLQLGRLAVAEAMGTCFAFWRRDPRCGGALVLAAKDLVPGAGWGLLDSDGDPKLPLAVLRRVWAPVAVTVVDDGLAGLRIDVHNDASLPLRGTLELVATDDLGNRTVTGATELEVVAHGAAGFHDEQLTGRFTDLAHAYRFGPRVAGAVDVRLLSDDGDVLARDALVLAPVRGRSNLSATAVQTDSGWELELSAGIPLRYVCIEADGWRPSDDCFALAAGVPYRVTLAPDGGADRPRAAR
ncbi:glycoside hydrolase family 2 protein [Tsukamurella soli]|uniref:beta-mannosidase n=1 Tax=Tsukamurella soli TaxID=644556 RepID=UPI0036189F07